MSKYLSEILLDKQIPDTMGWTYGLVRTTGDSLEEMVNNAIIEIRDEHDGPRGTVDVSDLDEDTELLLISGLVDLVLVQ